MLYNQSVPGSGSPEKIALWNAARDEMEEKCAQVEKEFGLSKFPEWNFDQGTERIPFDEHYRY